MIQRVVHHPLTRREGKSLVKFVLVGGMSFCIHFFGYLLMSRLLFPEVNRILINVAAICFSVSFNYFAHRGWTYGSKERGVAQIARYLLVIATAGILQTTLFYIGFERLHLYDLFITIVVAGISAVFSFIAHRLFTFPQRARDAEEGERNRV